MHAEDHAVSTLTLKRVALEAGYASSVFLLVSPAILVFLWMLSLSLKNEVDNTAWPPVFIPSPPTLANYVEVFAREQLPALFVELDARHRWRRVDRSSCSACPPATGSPAPNSQSR